MWNERLILEAKALGLHMPQFYLYDINGNPYASGWTTPSEGGRSYQMTLMLGPYYPDEMPRLYVTSPATLRQYNSYKTINQEGMSNRFHTRENSSEGYVQICHINPYNWDPSRTCVDVFFRGILWLTAYEIHLRTGRDICEFC